MVDTPAPPAGKLTLARAALFGGGLFLASGLAAAGLVAHDLARIQELALEARTRVIPRGVAESERALDAERLGRFVETVVLSTNPEVRRSALATAKGIASRFTENLAAEDRQLLDSAMRTVEEAALRSDNADALTEQIQARLDRSAVLVQDAREALEAMAAESSAALERAVDHLVAYSTARKTGGRRDVLGDLEDQMASLPVINETSNRLLSTLGLMRANVVAVLAAQDADGIKKLSDEYRQLANRLQLMLVLLSRNGRPERIADLLREFGESTDVFSLQLSALGEHQESRDLGSHALASLASLTQRRSSDANAIVTSGVAAIESHTRQIMVTASLACVAFALLAFGVAAAGRREVLLPLVRATGALQALRSGDTSVTLSQTRIYELDELSKALASFRDATLQIRRMAAEQAEKSALLESVLASLDEGVLAVDRELKVICANGRFSQLHQLPANVCAPGTPLEAILRIQALRGDYGASGGEAEVARRVAAAARFEHARLEERRPGGIVIEASSNPMPGGGGVTTYNDVTARKAAEEAIRESARKLSEYATELERSNADLQQFAYVASHDLQEPLRTIGSYCQLLQRRYKGKLDADADEFISFAVEGASRMQQLINDLLHYSRVGTRGKAMQPTDVAKVVAVATENLKIAIEESGAKVVHDALPTIEGDEVQLTQLFQNLIGNAIKFRSADRPVEIRVGVADKGAEWQFSVRDNGIGFDPKYAERIFIIFQRLHTRNEYPGTGMGLAICKKIIERHGGRIWAESQPGAGSTFHFTLPKTSPSKPEDTDGPPHAR